MSQMHRCQYCDRLLPESAWYDDRFTMRCKECQRAYQAKRKGKQKEPPSTIAVRARLAEEGIPCTTGRAAGIPYCDLAAWGCVPVEAKGCNERGNGRTFCFRFSPKQAENGFPGYLALAAWFKSGDTRFYVVPSTAEWLPKDTGSINLTIDPAHQMPNSYSHILERYENAFFLLRDALDEYQKMLAKIRSTRLQDVLPRVQWPDLEEITSAPLLGLT